MALIPRMSNSHPRRQSRPRRQDFPRKQDFPRCPLRLRETPYTTPSGLPLSISEHTASLLPCKGGYPQLRRRGYHSFPRSSGDISISHLGVSRGHRNVPHTSHCISKATPDSSGLRRPPSRTLLLYNGSFPQEPQEPDNPTTQRTLNFLRRSVHHNVSHKYAEYTHMNTIIRLLYDIHRNTSCFFKKTHV